MEPSDDWGKSLRLTRMIATLMLIVAPAIYLVIALLATPQVKTGGEHEIVLYILLLVAMVQPALVPVIERVQIASHRRNDQSKMTAPGFLTTISIIRCGFVEPIYIYGLIIYFDSGSLNNMLVFYAVGIIWSFVHWPWPSTVAKLRARIEAA